jgi:hypothetical protein
MPDAYK